MDDFQVICTVFVAVVTCLDLSIADGERMVSEAESITVAIDFETKLECTMNIQPDSFQWKFYPLSKKDACNPKARISLTTSPFQFVSLKKYESTTQKKTSSLILQADADDIAGDYQCLAHYGASVVASIPWRVTISNITDFPQQNPVSATISEGNTVNWRCEPPQGNPEPYIDYWKDHKDYQLETFGLSKSLIIQNVHANDSGNYTCQSSNVEGPKNSTTSLQLKVVSSELRERPRFLMPQKGRYDVLQKKDVLLECGAVGYPLPEMVWRKRNGRLFEDRSEMTYGGLLIKDVNASDGGVYECTQRNSLGKLQHFVELNYQEMPDVNCVLNSTDIDQGHNLDLDCSVSGSPEPEITWFLNGFAVNDSQIVPVGNKIYFKPVEKRHAGNLQIFARNEVGTVYRSIFIKVIPLSQTQESIKDFSTQSYDTRGRGTRRKKTKKHKTNMVPPSKPLVSRINDESVMLRWMVQQKGLPIQFFKVQYKELGPANSHEHRIKAGKWMTLNADIPPHITSHEVTNLKPDHYYRFRIAAVYSNNDNKNSPNSEKFHLRRADFARNPLPVPLITHLEPHNSTAVEIYWTLQSPTNVTVEGFVINYMSASTVGDYMKATVDGNLTNSYILSHLENDTVYDIKLQSFTSKSFSEPSSVLKVRTKGIATTTVPSTVSQTSNVDSAGISKLYIIIAVAVLGTCGLIAGVVVLLLFYRRSKQKKNVTRGDSDQADRHIQGDGNDYVVTPKSTSRSNGFPPSNRITITPNPLADADNKNQNMIEMSCLSSQNNNCASVQPSVSGEDSPTNARNKKNKSREKRIRDKRNFEAKPAGENYV